MSAIYVVLHAIKKLFDTKLQIQLYIKTYFLRVASLVYLNYTHIGVQLLQSKK